MLCAFFALFAFKLFDKILNRKARKVHRKARKVIKTFSLKISAKIRLISPIRVQKILTHSLGIVDDILHKKLNSFDFESVRFFHSF